MSCCINKKFFSDLLTKNFFILYDFYIIDIDIDYQNLVLINVVANLSLLKKYETKN